MNILQVHDRFELGGAETHIVSLSEALSAQGHNVYLATAPGPGEALLSGTSVTHLRLPLDRVESQMDALLSLINIIREWSIDIVHAHPFNSQIVASFACMAMGIPLVTTWHGPYIAAGLNRTFADYTSHFVAVSPEVKGTLAECGVPSHKVSVIPNSVRFGAPPRRSKLFCRDKISICYVSRLDSDKLPSVEIFLSMLAQSNEPLDVLIVGDGDCYEQVLNMAQSLDNTYEHLSVKLLGSINNVMEVIDSVDIVAGMGRVVLEGVAAGKFVLCVGYKNYLGLIRPEMLKDIAAVNFTDRIRGLEQSSLKDDLKRLKNNFRSEFENLCATWRVAQEEFSIDAAASKHLDVYTDILASYIPPDFSYNLYTTSGLSEELANHLDFYTSPSQRYPLHGARNKRVLFSPRFHVDSQRWVPMFRQLLERYSGCEETTIVVRIQNNDHAILDTVVGQLAGIIGEFREPRADILVDCEYHDPYLESCFLKSMHYYMPTGFESPLFVLNCALAGLDPLRR